MPDGILVNAKRLQTLISNILDVTRIESQTLILNKERFDIRDLASSVIEDYKDRTKDSNIQLIIKIIIAIILFLWKQIGIGLSRLYLIY